MAQGPLKRESNQMGHYPRGIRERARVDRQTPATENHIEKKKSNDANHSYVVTFRVANLGKFFEIIEAVEAAARGELHFINARPE